MTDLHLYPGDHLAIIKPDDRSRVSLKNWMTPEPIRGFKIYRFDGGKTIVLEAVQ